MKGSIGALEHFQNFGLRSNGEKFFFSKNLTANANGWVIIYGTNGKYENFKN